MEEDLAEPMVKYWKTKYHDSLDHEMQVECTPEEWIARGIKVCFVIMHFLPNA